MKSLAFAVLLLLTTIPLAAQELAPGELRASDARLNFSVPDAPAFAILNYTPSVIIRPTTVREIGLAVADFIRGGSVLPKAFAAEFSPGLLAGGSTLSIREYNANPFWYRTRISIASRSFDDNTGRIQASLGVRMTLMDDADPRMNRHFIQDMSRMAMSINQTLSRSVQVAPPTESGVVSVQSPDLEVLEAEVSRLRAQQRDESWNANIAEIAAAVRFSSSDSLAKNAVADKYQLWIAASFGASEWGQFIFNLTGSVERAQTFVMDSTSIAMNSRFYFGSNSIKVYGEGQITALDNSPALYLFNIGGEITPISSFWLEFSAGFEKRGKEPAIIRTAFHVRWGLPEGIIY